MFLRIVTAEIVREFDLCAVVIVIETYFNGQRVLGVCHVDFQRGAVFEGELHLHLVKRLLAGEDEVMLCADGHGLLLLRAAVQSNFAAAGDFFHIEEALGEELDARNIVNGKAAAVFAGQGELRDQGAEENLAAAVNDDLLVTVMELDGVGDQIRREAVRQDGQLRQNAGFLYVIGTDAFDLLRGPVHNVVGLHGEAVNDGVLRPGQVDGLGERHRNFVQRTLGEDRLVHRDVQPDIA